MATTINFDNLSLAEQRVIIAQDLIARLNAKTFIAESGTYLEADDRLPDKSDRELLDTEVRDILKGKVCTGCQIGGLFLCAVDRHNKLKLREIGVIENNDCNFRGYLFYWFDFNQQREMEAAFEGRSEYGDWFDLHSNADRMRLIAENIIAGGGEFDGKRLLETSVAMQRV